jgi:DNA-binding transcriptional MerR regulator
LRGNRELAFLLLHCRELALRGERELIPIGQAAEKAGISRQSLQYYLMIGLLEPTEVTPTGRRLFDSKAVERIALIKRLNDSGYPLRAIRELFMEGRTGTKGDSGE